MQYAAVVTCIIQCHVMLHVFSLLCYASVHKVARSWVTHWGRTHYGDPIYSHLGLSVQHRFCSPRISARCMHTGRQPIEDPRREDVDRRRGGVRVLLAAAVRRQHSHLLRVSPGRRRRRVRAADADRHPGRPVDRAVQLRRQPGGVLPVQR